MVIVLHRKRLLCIVISVVVIVLLVVSGSLFYIRSSAVSAAEEDDYIKWVDFNVTYKAMDYALQLDIETHGCEFELHWIELLAYLAAKNGNNFSGFKTSQLDAVADEIKGGIPMEELTADLSYYSYYLEAYTAILSGLVGEYEVEVADETSETGTSWERCYGLIGFSPIAQGYYYTDCDDFGVSRSYGYTRKHLGHDMMGSIGTPIIAVEGGVVEALGWNQYGGWRIGIRSFDNKRYYYYAHLRKDLPYNTSLEVGSVVQAGDVIGYLGRTGYSQTENVNNIVTPHLHFGLQLIFDESQKESYTEIWVDVYSIVKLLYQNRSEVVTIDGTKEFTRTSNIRIIVND
jgi:murein DD-endopeptidase MepM/ murein hydrolase activator NlpD